MKHSGGALLTSIQIDQNSARNISTQIYMGIRDIILTGGVVAGERLPASRTLAKELGVSRTTVINSLDRLMSEGLLEARSGAGTFVSDVMNSERPAPSTPAASVSNVGTFATPLLSHSLKQALPNLALRTSLPSEASSFVTGLPDLATFPMAQWARLMSKHWRGDRGEVMGYGHPFGQEELRRAIASHVNASRGIQCDPSQIFITAGAQQAFHLISSMLLNSGDKVWIENPGAIGARNSFISCGADLVPVEVDNQGISVADGLAKAPDFRLAFVTPSHQQPLSVVMSLRRRFALLKAVDQANAWVVEDDYDSEFYFGGQPLPTLKSVDTIGRVIYVGTFSKTLFPSLRIGFILSPPGLVEYFEKLSASSLQGIPTSLQMTVADFMNEGHFATHVRRMRGIYAERYEALMEASTKHLSGLLDVQETQSGLHTVGYLDSRADEAEITKALLRKGITANGIGRHCIAPIKKKGLALGFGTVRPEAIHSCVRTLATVLKNYLK